jgi:hypothetical protein
MITKVAMAALAARAVVALVVAHKRQVLLALQIAAAVVAVAQTTEVAALADLAL